MTKHTDQQFRSFFDRAIAKATATGDADKIAKLELTREYFFNPKFRKELEEFTWRINESI